MRNLIVTHHAPDLDAITSVWLLKKFDAQHYADAKIFFVDPGDKISESERSQLDFTPGYIMHVDTGLGKFDHHQEGRAQKFTCAAKIVWQNHLCRLHPELIQDQALQELINFVTEIDHFKEISWPNPSDLRYNFMIHELINGLEAEQLHDDDSMLNFGMKCLDGAYHSLTNRLAAAQKITQKSIKFKIKTGPALAIATRNDDVLKLAQKQGFVLVIKKDSHQGNIRIKARPDADLSLEKLYQEILELDQTGDWFYHNSGKMLINGSRKKQHTPSTLSLDQIIELVKNLYG